MMKMKEEKNEKLRKFKGSGFEEQDQIKNLEKS